MSKEKEHRRLLASFKLDERVVINFLDKQDNATNAIRYLIMKEVKENGYRNLNNIIPAKITEEFFNFDFSSLENTEELLGREIKETVNDELSISADEAHTEVNEITIVSNNNITENNKKLGTLPDSCYLDPDEI